MSNGLNLLHPRKDIAEMVIVFCVSFIVPEDLMFVLILMIERRGVCTSDKLFVCPEFLKRGWNGRLYKVQAEPNLYQLAGCMSSNSKTRQTCVSKVNFLCHPYRS